MRLNPCHFIGIWPDFREISAVRPGEEIGRLEEVDVSVDITGQDEFAGAIERACACRARLVCRTNADDALAVDNHASSRGQFAIGGIDDSSADERDLVGARAERDKARNCKRGNFFHKSSLSPADSERTMRSASRSRRP